MVKPCPYALTAILQCDVDGHGFSVAALACSRSRWWASRLSEYLCRSPTHPASITTNAMALTAVRIFGADTFDNAGQRRVQRFVHRPHMRFCHCVHQDLRRACSFRRQERVITRAAEPQKRKPSLRIKVVTSSGSAVRICCRVLQIPEHISRNSVTCSRPRWTGFCAIRSSSSILARRPSARAVAYAVAAFSTVSQPVSQGQISIPSRWLSFHGK